MQISGQGIILSTQKFQENSAIVTVFTRNHGIQTGIANNVKSSKNSHIYLAGNFVDFVWNARLATHIGSIKCELVKAYGSNIMYNKLSLYALNSLLEIIKASLKPHEEYIELFDIIHQYISHNKFSFLNYINTELWILQEVGYSLDFSKCASTGSTENLSYVSPKSGKAVSEEAAEPYKDLMLKLPAFLLFNQEVSCPKQIRDAFDLTGYFFKRYIITNNKEFLARELFKETLCNLQ